MIRVETGDLVWIKWEDHYAFDRAGWVDQSTITIDPLMCETVGWVTKQDKDRIATSPSHDGQFNPNISASVSVCPKRMIVEIKVLKKTNKKVWK